MKRIQIDRTASQRADKPCRKRPSLFVFVLCLVMVSGTMISTALLGGSLSRYSQEESNVIALVPQAEVLRATGERATSGAGDAEKPKPPESPEAVRSTAEPRSTTVPRSTATAWNTTTSWNTTTFWRAAEGNNNTAARASEYQGELRVYDAVRSWSTETQVDLFKESYSESGDETVKAGDGKKVIAPGTSNFYTFTLENNGNLSLDYTISLKVENYNEGPESHTAIPLEWRLLDGTGSAVSNWRGYSENAEIMKQASLDERRQDNYTIEWRWAFERDTDRDRADTALGDLAAKQTLGAKATIIVYAEQDAEQNTGNTGNTEPGGGQSQPSLLNMWPKTGDTGNLTLYIVLMTISGCGLLILIQKERQRKKKE